jgi:hypothetical protein
MCWYISGISQLREQVECPCRGEFIAFATIVGLLDLVYFLHMSMAHIFVNDTYFLWCGCSEGQHNVQMYYF